MLVMVALMITILDVVLFTIGLAGILCTVFFVIWASLWFFETFIEH